MRIFKKTEKRKKVSKNETGEEMSKRNITTIQEGVNNVCANLKENIEKVLDRNEKVSYLDNTICERLSEGTQSFKQTYKPITKKNKHDYHRKTASLCCFISSIILIITTISLVAHSTTDKNYIITEGILSGIAVTCLLCSIALFLYKPEIKEDVSISINDATITQHSSTNQSAGKLL